MPEEEKTQNIEPSEKDIANHPEGLIFTDRQDNVNILPAANQRKREEGEDKNTVRESDFRTLKYAHSENEKFVVEERQKTADLAEEKLAEFRRGDPHSIGTGVEIEGVLYDKDGNFLPVHSEGIGFDTFPPELYRAQLEVVTGPVKGTEDVFPSSAVEIATTLAHTVNVGEEAATRRGGLLAFSSVPEGGTTDQLRLTNHPKVLSAAERGQTRVYEHAPQETKALAMQLGITDIVPFHGTHVHTSNPELPDGKFDARAAYAAGIIELTQISEVESFMLSNTKDYLGTHIDNMKDIRSIMKRAFLGAQDTTVPNNARDLVLDSMMALKSGDTHEMSRHPVTGQHDRVRVIKEFGTTESVGGAANPDLRIILAHTYFKQLSRALSYKALEATHGDESQVLPYLQKRFENGKYGYLFEQLKTQGDPNSSFEQDKRFNSQGFDAEGNNGRSYREQMQDVRTIMRKLGKEFPAFKTQARIVDHVLGKIAEQPDNTLSLAEYLDPETGMKGGIVTDYKSENIAENIRSQAEGTKKQADMLQNIQNEKQLLEFFGLKENRVKSFFQRFVKSPIRRK
jgi:hypothetical protein